jgi:hypothetical protein
VAEPLPARNVLDLPSSHASSQLSLVTVRNSRVQVHQLDFRGFNAMRNSSTSHRKNSSAEKICVGLLKWKKGKDRLPKNAAFRFQENVGCRRSSSAPCCSTVQVTVIMPGDAPEVSRVAVVSVPLIDPAEAL